MARNRGITIGIVGAGKIGATIATLLESCAFCEAVVLADVRTAVKIAGLGKASVTKLDAEQRTALTVLPHRIVLRAGGGIKVARSALRGVMSRIPVPL